MAAQNSQGIQTLLEAEKEASKIVQKARQYRVDRLKAARSEAEKEIQALKAQKVAEFAAFEKEHIGSSDEVNQKNTRESEEQIANIKATFQQNKNQVLDKLVKCVVTVEPKVHINSKLKVAA